MAQTDETKRRIRRSAVISVLFVVISFAGITFVQQQLFTHRARVAISDFDYRFGHYRAIYEYLNASESGISIEVDVELRNLQFVNTFLTFFNLSSLYERGQAYLLDPFNYVHPSFDLERFWLDTDIIGYLSIPAIDLKLPVFLGTSHHNLNRGLAHLTHSSFPVGGQSSNTVIAGHRNLHFARVFRDIELLVPGDEIRFPGFYQTLSYVEVYSQVTHPDQVDVLHIHSGRDLFTLVTQRSNGLNRHGDRFVVTAERVE